MLLKSTSSGWININYEYFTKLKYWGILLNDIVSTLRLPSNVPTSPVASEIQWNPKELGTLLQHPVQPQWNVSTAYWPVTVQGVAKIAPWVFGKQHFLNKKQVRVVSYKNIQKLLCNKGFGTWKILKFFSTFFHQVKMQIQKVCLLTKVHPRFTSLVVFDHPLWNWIGSSPQVDRRKKKKTSLKPPPRFSRFRCLSSHLGRSCYPKDAGWKPNFAKPFWKICHPFARFPISALVRTLKILQNGWELRELE